MYSLPEPRASPVESGYASVSSIEDDEPEIEFTKSHLRFLNKQLQFLEPQGLLPPQIIIVIIY